MSEPLMQLTDVDTAALLPASVVDDPDVKAILAALDAFWRQIGAAVPGLAVLATIDVQPAAVLDILAPQFHVDYWDADWPVERKRAVIRNSIRLHKIAGTRKAVDDTVADIWGDAAIIYEWWEYGGEPGTFQVVLTDSSTQSAIPAFTQSIKNVKRATDHMSILIQNDAGSANLHVAAVCHIFRALYA